jgi:hypothetical protein
LETHASTGSSSPEETLRPEEVLTRNGWGEAWDKPNKAKKRTHILDIGYIYDMTIRNVCQCTMYLVWV